MAQTKTTTNTATKDKDKPKPVCCRDCENENQDTDGISFRMSDHYFFLCTCKCGHHIDKFGRQSKLFRDNERICKDFIQKASKS